MVRTEGHVSVECPNFNPKTTCRACDEKNLPSRALQRIVEKEMRKVVEMVKEMRKVFEMVRKMKRFVKMVREMRNIVEMVKEMRRVVKMVSQYCHQYEDSRSSIIMWVRKWRLPDKR